VTLEAAIEGAKVRRIRIVKAGWPALFAVRVGPQWICDNCTTSQRVEAASRKNVSFDTRRMENVRHVQRRSLMPAGMLLQMLPLIVEPNLFGR